MDLPRPKLPGFHYTTLLPGEIRLFRLTNIEDNELSFHLETFSIGQAAPYTALSYRWGDTSRDVRILTNEQELYITASLETFLNELGRRKPARQPSSWFWIDAVCINQDDIIERNQQVSRMKEIYEKAQAIVIWLGPGEDGTSDAIDFLEDLAALECSDMNIEDGTTPGTSCRLGDDANYIEVLYATLTFDVAAILQSPYWNRSWIIQEASTPIAQLSDDECTGTSIWCGEHTISWDKLCEANRRLIEASWNNPVSHFADLHGIANEDIATLSHIQGRRAKNVNSEALYPMLVRSRTSGAADPRDKLYSILGLVNNTPKGIQPDYSLAVEQVYTKLAISLIIQSKSLDSLGSAGFAESSVLPSWVPDWRIPHDAVPQPFYQTDRTHNDDGSVKRERNLFQADGAKEATANFSSDGKVLNACGVYFDTVAELSTPRMWLRSDWDSVDLWEDWVTTVGPSDGKYPSGTSRFEAFAKVLKADFEDVWGDWSSVRGSVIDGFTDTSINAFQLQDPIVNAMTSNRCFFRTSRGYLGLGPPTMMKEDAIYVLHGAQMPLVLRKVDKHWIFLGQTYLHGIMDGEAQQGSCQSKTVDLEIW